MSLLTSSPPVYDLSDRFRPGSGPVLLTGVQAIARLLVEQHTRDQREGRHTGTFVSGYQGSPLGGVDRMLAGMKDVLDAHDVHFQPGYNEELAATSVWGSQLVVEPEAATHDGVIGFWYGKGPGVDRATDAIRHANLYGTNPNGGMVLLVGDDPASKSSTVPAVSERSLAALGVPVLFPRNATEIITFGMHAVALSRASGCVVALKIVADVADGSWTVTGEELERLSITPPAVSVDDAPFTYTQRPMAVAPDIIMAAEADFLGPRWEMVNAYAAANELNHIEVNPPSARVGIAATGTTYDAVRQALQDLGVTDDQLSHAGIRLLHLGMVYPVSERSVIEFADGLEEVIVVEDKTPFVETQFREILYGRDDAPRIRGKKDHDGRELVPVGGELTASRLHAPLRAVLQEWVTIKPPRPAPLPLTVLPQKRTAYFCSGCPHNTSTAVPDGSHAAGGIGCHILVTMSARPDSQVTGLTQMGGEGSQWIGQAPFTRVPHIFQNIGDGTYFHSGQLAVQACIAAGTNITYKLLHNDVVAMTGAQDVEGGLSIAQLSHRLMLEGVARIIVCSDDPARHRRRDFPTGVHVWDRSRLDEAQRVLREVPGVTVLIFDQHCAADARRQRKRGKLPARNTRVVINEEVCEGCGDCGVKSNCLSVQPVDTELGRKTRIDQTSCNTDYSCLAGDCPSFVTVEVSPNTKRRKTTAPVPSVSAEPKWSEVKGTWNVFLAGIGGTGILTVNQVLATAAMRAGYDVEALDQIGLSQKAGPVVSHLRFSAGQVEPSNRLSTASADCILAFDLLTVTDSKNLAYGDPARTITIASTSRTPTGDMVYDKSITYPDDTTLVSRMRSATRELFTLDALSAAQALFTDTTTSNLLLVGAAYQAGALPIASSAIEEAIEINGVAVDANIAAFRWGRVAVADPGSFAAATGSRTVAAEKPFWHGPIEVSGSLRDLVADRAGRLCAYQNERLAARYVHTVERVYRVEQTVTNRTEFSTAVARYLYKLTAYKDEYEVARLLTDPGFLAHVQGEVPSHSNLTYKLHPPALRAMGKRNKIGIGPRGHQVLKLLARGKYLRGTVFDPFGATHMRRLERRLAAHYALMVISLADALSAENYDTAVEIASLPDAIRGYENIKLENVEVYRRRLAELDMPAF
jgi:indolepyruvate ferredoxin oxidoreductase